MKHFNVAAAVAAVMAAPITAMPNDGVFARAGCAHDNCFRAILNPTTRITDCSSYMSATVTPCPSTVTASTTITTTTTVAGPWPMKKRDGIAAPLEPNLQARDETASACTPITNSPTALPTYAATLCTQVGTTAPAARFSSACSCDGVTGATTTIPAITTTVTSTSTIVATATATPDLFILQATGDQSLYITVDNTNAVVLTRDTNAAVPFYVDNSGQMRLWSNPAKLFVDYYQPHPGTADNKVYIDTPSNSNFAITCNNIGHKNGDYWGDCQSSGPPNGNPVVYGWGTYPNEGYYLYMTPNFSNVNCWDGGYSFLGFYLVTYTGK